MSGPAYRQAVKHLLSLQHADGYWEGEMVWNTMILSQYIIVRHVVGRPLSGEHAKAAIRHFEVTRATEGGWGMHRAGGPYVYFTTLAYVALRLLGVPPGDPLPRSARDWLHSRPRGVLAIPTWGKFWLALLGLYDYDGVNPFLPELFVLPRPFIIHPDRLYCHTRTIYQAIAYLYGTRFQTDLGDLGTELRAELYGRQIGRAEFAANRGILDPADAHVPPGPVLRAVYRLALGYERHVHRGHRRNALRTCLNRVLAEQRASRYQGLSPVSSLLNCLVLFAADPAHPDLDASLAGIEYWRWQDQAEGLRYCGSRSHSWDSAFALEALLTVDERDGAADEAVRRGHAFLRNAQLTEPLPLPPAGRADVTGGWCFSDGGHRWPVSDCTAEAVGALVHAEDTLGPDLPEPDRISAERVRQAIVFLLDRQNSDGSFGTYERRRAPLWLEAVNPSEMYANCMVEGSYIECTGSALAALARVSGYAGSALHSRARGAAGRAVTFLRRSQRTDGAFPAAWGVYLTYGTFMAVRGLRAAGLAPSDPVLRGAAAWLARTQRADGGWGEHYRGCLEHRYVEAPRSQPVATAWAVLGLLNCLPGQPGPAGSPAERAVETGRRWLVRQQRPDGGWGRNDAPAGVFFGTAMLDYRYYAAYFPAWALGACLRREQTGTAGGS